MFGDVLLQKFAKFTRKHLCQSLFFNKVAVLFYYNLRLYYKRDSGTYIFPQMLMKFLRISFLTEYLCQPHCDISCDSKHLSFYANIKDSKILSLYGKLSEKNPLCLYPTDQLQSIIFHFKNMTIFGKLSILLSFLKKEKTEDGSIMWITNEEISSTIENRKKKVDKKTYFQL